LRTGERHILAERPLDRLAYPEVWLLIVALPAVAYGITVGRIYREGDSLPTLLWAGASAVAGAVLGLLGGFIFARVRGLAALGAVEWAACFVLALELSSYGGHIRDDSGGLGLVVAVVFVVTFVPMIVAAFLASSVRPAPWTGPRRDPPD
jgi:hypothetical protein